MSPIINIVGKNSVDCNQVSVIATSSSTSGHHFIMEEVMEEVSLEEMLQTMCKNDFNGATTNQLNSRVMKDAEEVSSEDRGFLQIFQKKTGKAGENYVVPLPFQNESLEMPNNRKQAMKSSMHLKCRFKRNPRETSC